MKQFPSSPEAPEAALRWAACLREEGMHLLAEVRKGQTSASAKPEEAAAAAKVREEGLRPIREAVAFLEGQLHQLRSRQPQADVRVRMLYESAWEYRALADAEVADARAKFQQDKAKKLQEQVAKAAPPAGVVLPVALPEIPLSEVPLQPAEQKARAQYKSLIADFPHSSLAVEARWELGELLTERGDLDGAVSLFSKALAAHPPPDLARKIRLRLGACHASAGRLEQALAEFDQVAQDQQDPLAAQAHYRAGECLMHRHQWAKATARLAIFRDQPAYQNLPGLTDRAILRLGQALAHLGQWDQSRQANELVLSRFPASPWIQEARYATGWAWQNLKQYDHAVNTYGQITATTTNEIAAKAQLQIGLCRLEQLRYSEATTALLVVPFTYDYPEWAAAALCEAGRAFAEMHQPDQASRLWRRVVQDHPNSQWAAVAGERLAGLEGR
jgi:TolA-binding protein